MLLPNALHPEFGKLLFCAIDILTGWLIYLNGSNSVRSSRLLNQFKTGLCVFWLFNPFIAIISARGNADTLVCACITLVLYFLAQDQVTSQCLNVINLRILVHPSSDCTWSVGNSFANLSDYLSAFDLRLFCKDKQQGLYWRLCEKVGAKLEGNNLLCGKSSSPNILQIFRYACFHS
jgi:hypothetical protein